MREWSLEHIHAQHAQALTQPPSSGRRGSGCMPKRSETCPRSTVDARDALLAGIAGGYDGLTAGHVQGASVEVSALFGAEDGGETFEEQVTHSILNLALLKVGDNAALSNSGVRSEATPGPRVRGQGAYIPVCTRRVFLKYYTPARAQQVHFWGAQDRDAYRDAMLHPETGILTPYLEPEEPRGGAPRELHPSCRCSSDSGTDGSSVHGRSGPAHPARLRPGPRGRCDGVRDGFLDALHRAP